MILITCLEKSLAHKGYRREFKYNLLSESFKQILLLLLLLTVLQVI